MPLSVPLLLVPGDPDRFYTVHVHRVRWSVGAVSVPLTAAHLAELEDNARRCLRMVSECIAAELADADVEVIEHPVGAEAVARVLCDSETCAAVAERYHRDADEDIEAEAARAWAATKLQDQTVQLLRLRGEMEKTTPGKTPADLLAAVLAAQQERTGGQTDRVTLMLDEAAVLLRDNALFTDRSPEGVRAELDRLARQGRAPYPTETDGEGFVGEMRRGKTRLHIHRLTDLDSAADLTTWTPDPADPTFMTPERLVRETETLARRAASGNANHVAVHQLAHLSGEVACRSAGEPRPTCPEQWPDDCPPDSDLGHELMHRVGDRPKAIPAGEVRAARIPLDRATLLHTLPATLPDDDAALVLVYRTDTPGLALLDAVRAGDDDAVRDAVTGLLRWLTADGK